MLFTKKLRASVKSGQVTASVRIWKTPRVKVGGRYRLEDGQIEVSSIREISWEDLTDQLARDTGFNNLIDMMKTAKHGSGQHIYYIRFRFVPGPARRVSMRQNRAS
jgi:ribosomal protein L20A (L18A)